MQNFDQNIGFWEKRQFFRPKLSKIAENCDHNIDPRWLSYQNLIILVYITNICDLHIFHFLLFEINIVRQEKNVTVILSQLF
jgi:hypothetical protein